MIRRFDRLELKYVLPVARSTRLMADLRPRVAPDEHGQAGGYSVVNLYYDSPDYACFWSKIQKLPSRRKVRLRIYPGSDITGVERASIEIKERARSSVRKRRLELSLEQAGELCAGRLPNQSLDELDAQVAREVSHLSREMQLKPAAITAYWRQAYEASGDDAGLRVTFDTFVASRIHDLAINAPGRNCLLLPSDWCVMEIKAKAPVPGWLLALLDRHRCEQVRLSKYCMAVALLRGLEAPPRWS